MIPGSFFKEYSS